MDRLTHALKELHRTHLELLSAKGGARLAARNAYMRAMRDAALVMEPATIYEVGGYWYVCVAFGLGRRVLVFSRLVHLDSPEEQTAQVAMSDTAQPAGPEAEATNVPSEPPPKETKLERMKRDELVALAQSLGLSVDESLTKRDLIALIQAHN